MKKAPFSSKIDTEPRLSMKFLWRISHVIKQLAPLQSWRIPHRRSSGSMQVASRARSGGRSIGGLVGCSIFRSKNSLDWAPSSWLATCTISVPYESWWLGKGLFITTIPPWWSNIYTFVCKDFRACVCLIQVDRSCTTSMSLVEKIWKHFDTGL